MSQIAKRQLYEICYKSPEFPDLSDIDPTHPDFHQEALVPLQTEGHAVEDVGISARGPWSHLFHSTHEQHDTYHVVRHAYGW